MTSHVHSRESNRPAALGGKPAFPESLPYIRPAIPPLSRVVRRLRPSYDKGRLTDGELVRELEQRVADRLEAEFVVAVASGTAGLMLALQALNVDGPVVMPSMTFSATAHAAEWNCSSPRFAECDPATFCLDPADLARRLDGAAAVVATHIFGAPCDTGAIERLAAEAGIPVCYDAAHAFGAQRGGKPVGTFGDAEVFSLTPTKPLVAGEGGLVVTNRKDVADAVRRNRNYGDRGDYYTVDAGLNGRMSELHAAVALESLVDFDSNLRRRRAVAAAFRAGLSGVPGLRFQAVDEGSESTYKDCTLLVDPDQFGLDRDGLLAALSAEGVEARRYFDPPVHRHHAYAHLPASDLPVTDAVARSMCNLPIFPDLAAEEIERLMTAIAGIHAFAGEIADVQAGGSRR